jgi:hypothetical protein
MDEALSGIHRTLDDAHRTLDASEAKSEIFRLLCMNAARMKIWDPITDAACDEVLSMMRVDGTSDAEIARRARQRIKEFNNSL